MKKVVINKCYGGFSLSDAAIRKYLTIKQIPFEERIGKYKETMFCHPGGADWSLYREISDITRDDTVLVEIVEEMGSFANGNYADLAIEVLSPGTLYMIKEYDGKEWIETRDTMSWSQA